MSLRMKDTLRSKETVRRAKRKGNGWSVPFALIPAVCLPVSVTVASLTVASATMAGVTAAQRAPATASLPLIESPVSGSDSTLPVSGSGSTLALFMTGDGGWAELARDVSAGLNRAGIPVVALNTRAYLDHRRTPDELSADMSRVLEQYLRQWHRERIIVMGFSRGADFAPFVVNRLPLEQRARVAIVAMIAPAPAASFEFHLVDLVRDVKRPTDIPLAPEVNALHDVRVLCVYGADEKESFCRDAPDFVRRAQRPGGHHFDNDYHAIAELILRALTS
jgi:type IV secretory pathway VirJ component